MCGDDVISDVIKMPFTDVDGHLIKAFQKEKHGTASDLIKKICEQKLESEKIDKFGSVWYWTSEYWVMDVAQLVHVIIV